MAENTPATASRSASNYLPPSSPPANEGNTRAAWTAMILVMFGAVVIGVGMVIPAIAIVVVGAVIIVGGLVVGAVLRKAGHGQPVD
ncbi:HGxxPAAW family protein [Luteimicrobium sp. DT211]|uniref:HGxxPAAW family protein n=1 Tax=Luteimicrobium sp. DT211 TaxID=3393412 RepID=UPI003CEE1B11